jgi:uncharacterized membrane protein YkvA (DUF1232 family)
MYRNVQANQSFIVAMGILQAISPIDMIPDIPFVGCIDDVVVLIFVWRDLSKEVKKYETFLSNQG